MGCAPTKPTKEELADQLNELYQIKETIGCGAFATVYRCIKRTTGEEVAVKALAHDEEQGARLKRAVDMAASLQHECIVSFRDTLINRNSTFIVMDRYRGGDLVDGVNFHFLKNKKMDSMRATHIGSQMAAALSYIHRRSIAHRDIKGDNFLIDRNDIINKDCRIALCDFDTAVYLEPEERLRDTTGTRIYWAPESFQRNYGLKVDVWAMGVTLYGVLSGRSLFKDEKQIKYKKPVFDDHVDEACQDYLFWLLQKGEEERFNSHQALAHRWMKGDTTEYCSVKAKTLSNDSTTTSASGSFCLDTSDGQSDCSTSSASGTRTRTFSYGTATKQEH